MADGPEDDFTILLRLLHDHEETCRRAWARFDEDPDGLNVPDLRARLAEEALAFFEDARDELIEHPEGARLARLVMQGMALTTAPDIVAAFEWRAKGAASTKAKWANDVKDRNAEIRARAAKLSADLSTVAKAQHLSGEYRLSVRTIRRILKK